MAIQSGTRLGPYEITTQIGAGGMGEVYRATDTNLKRAVAIKVLPESVATDRDRLARFQREAEVLASLNHSNIAAIYGLERSAGVTALVMEFVEGPTLAERIAQGPIRVDEALPIAKQIAEALEAAHEQGIIHRDLKPANVKIRTDGTVKVLDFGLAKALEPTSAAGMDATASPTITSPAMMTGVGVLLGTAAYMSPEQARGKNVDKRTDIWAFGCVFYEMLTSKRAFDGTNATDVIAAVVRAEPDWAVLPADTPPGLRALLRRCLEKDPKLRLRDIGDARFELDEVLRAPASAKRAAVERGDRTFVPLWPGALLASVGALVVAGLGVYAGWILRPEPIRPIARFTVTLPDGQRFTGTNRHAVALSPIGTHLVFNAGGRLYLRAFDQVEALPIRGTENALTPFFSPDGQWIGFWQDGQLKKVSVAGGAVVTICATTSPLGASWGADGTILFGQGTNGIMRVPDAGGTPEVLIKVESGQSAHGPQLLPDGRTLLFTLGRVGASWDGAQVVVQSLESGERRVAINGGADGRYVPTGHLIYALEGTLFAVPFDADALEIRGGPVPLIEDIARTENPQAGAAQFSTSGDGVLAYVSGFGAFARRNLVWVERNGQEQRLTTPPDTYRYPRVSPDGTRVLLDLRGDIWIWHLTRETLTRLTLDPAGEQYAVWMNDQRVIFGSPRSGGVSNLFSQAADGTGAVERLTESKNFQFPLSVSADGMQLVFGENLNINVAGVAANNADLMLLPLQGDRRTQPVVQTPFNEINGEISPDGRWLAYESNESGRFEVYVRPFPDASGGRWQVSTEGGTRALWARNGRELFYITPAGDALMKVDVLSGPGFKAGSPVRLLDTRAFYFTPTTIGLLGNPGRMYDVSPDGRRFLLLKDDSTVAAPGSITVVQGWFDELRLRVPVN